MEFDVLIRNGEVIDGARDTRRRRADVGISGERVAAIGDLRDASAATEIDATGKIVAPGFVDVHIHSEIELLGGPNRYAGLLQGVTTQLLTPDGFGWAPLTPEQARELWEATVAIYGPLKLEPDWQTPEAFLDLFKGNTPANVLPQVPHTAVRFAAMGWAARPATDDELEVMRGLVRQWMEAGATCLCLGLDYQPSAFSDTRELIELSKVAVAYDGIYTAHVRYNMVGLESAWRETMEIGKHAEIPLHISHEYVRDVTAGLLAEAREVCDLTFESYMYPAGCTHLLNLMPMPYQAGGPDGVRARLQTDEGRQAISETIATKLRADYEIGSRAIFANTRTGRWVGQDMVSAAEREDMPLEQFVLEVFDAEFPEGLMVYRRGDTPEEINAMVRRTFSHPQMMVASDGIYYGPHAHPRGYGCFARAIRKGVRELGAVSLEVAVWKMAGFPAERFRIPQRGQLRENWFADVVVFDPDEYGDRSTWEEPRLHPAGVERVLVNGRIVIANGEPTGAVPGHVISGRG